MFTCVCPRCKGKGEADDHTKAILGIKHTDQCGYMHGLPTTFNAEEVGGEAPKVDPNVIIKDETQPVEMTSGEKSE